MNEIISETNPKTGKATAKETIKSMIEDFAISTSKTNPFAIAAKNGTLAEQNVVNYLRDLMWIFQEHSAKILPAIQRAKEMGLEEVVRFMEEKHIEEKDHYQWAQQDLKNRGVEVNAQSSEGVSTSARQLISHIDDLIQKDPTLYISYMVLVEYFTVLAAPEFLKNIEENCGIPQAHLTAISKHVLADQKHVVDDLQIISKVVQTPSQQQDMIASLRQSMKLVDQFLRECARVPA